MNASKVRIDQDTWTVNKVDAKKRKALRTAKLLELIRSKPAGYGISSPEVARVCRFNTDGAAFAFMQGLERDGIIRKTGNKMGKHGVPYEVVADVKAEDVAKHFITTDENLSLGVTSQVTQTNIEPAPAYLGESLKFGDHVYVPDEATKKKLAELEQPKQPDIEQLAQQYLWQLAKDNSYVGSTEFKTIKGFVEWAKEKGQQ